MIAGTYILSGVLLAGSGWLFAAGLLTATTQTICWSAVFFVGSAAASSAYLTVSEIFPLEIRAQAIAVFFAVAQVIGYIKGKSAIHLARVYGEKKRNFVGQHFWARGYFVSTVGRDEEVIREYIRRQEKEDERLDQLKLEY